jgi:arylsulfatase A-like enzyme
VDEQAGRILEALERRGKLENTLILFVSDHGDMMGDHYLWRKSYAYEASAGVPMMVRWGAEYMSEKRGKFVDEVVELRDILPTFLDAAGASVDEKRYDGRSLLDPIRGKAEGWRKYIDLEHNICYSPDNHWNAVTDGKVKYIYHARDGRQQLFNLVNDPKEMHELAGDAGHAELLKTWRGYMVAALEERGAPFVANGELAPRAKGTPMSPHYPGRSVNGRP